MEADHEQNRYVRRRILIGTVVIGTSSSRANPHSAKQRSRCSRLAGKQVRSSCATWGAMDRDHDGTVTLEEMQDFMRGATSPTASQH